MDVKLVTVSKSSIRLRGERTDNKGVPDVPRGSSALSVFSSMSFPSLSPCSSHRCSLGACAPGREGTEPPGFVCTDKETLPRLREQIHRSC